MPPSGSTEPPSTSGGRRRWIKVVRLTALAVILVFVTLFLVGNWSDIVNELRNVTGLQIALATVAIVGGLLFSMLAWRETLSALGHTLPVRASARIYFLGQLGKYVPGSVWPIVAQAELAKEFGTPRAMTGIASLVQMLMSLLTAIAFSVACLLIGAPEVIGSYWWLIPIAVIGTVCLIPRIFETLLRTLSRVIRRPLPRDFTIAGRGFGIAILACLGMWLAFGLHFQALVSSSVVLDGSLMLVVWGAYALAWAVGFVIVFVPAGAGAREAVLVFVLSPFLGAPEALGFALLSRFLMLLADFLLPALAIVAERRRNRTLR